MAGAVLGIRQKRAAELDALNQEYWALLREASQQ
jgi:hypothetical protein